MHWNLEPCDDHGHVLVNRTGGTASSVTATALDAEADAWHPVARPFRPERHARIRLEGEVRDGEHVGGWTFTPGPDDGGTIEIRWTDERGGVLAEYITAPGALESREAL